MSGSYRAPTIQGRPATRRAEPPREVVLSAALATYTYLLFFVGRFEPFQAPIIWGLGPAVTGLTLLSFLRRPFRFPLDAAILFGFLPIALVGLRHGTVTESYFYALRILAEIAIYYFCVQVALLRSGKATWFFLSLVSIALSSIGYSFYTGDVGSLSVSEQYRLAGQMGNPNGYAQVLVAGIAGALFVFHDGTRRSVVLLLLIIGVLAVGVVFTASRGGFLTLMLTLGLWALTCYRGRVRNRSIVTMAVALAAVLMVWRGFEYLEGSTFLGARLGGLAAEERRSGSRSELSFEAWDVFLSNPVFGIGLGQFQEVSAAGQYAHSDVMELLSCAGLTGFVIYGAVYLTVWRTLMRAGEVVRDTALTYRVRVCKVAFLSFLCAGLFRVNFLDVLGMTQLAVISAYAQYLINETLAPKGRLARTSEV